MRQIWEFFQIIFQYILAHPTWLVHISDVRSDGETVPWRPPSPQHPDDAALHPRTHHSGQPAGPAEQRASVHPGPHPPAPPPAAGHTAPHRAGTGHVSVPHPGRCGCCFTYAHRRAQLWRTGRVPDHTTASKWWIQVCQVLVSLSHSLPRAVFILWPSQPVSRILWYISISHEIWNQIFLYIFKFILFAFI